jgi:heat shock protein HslJ
MQSRGFTLVAAGIVGMMALSGCGGKSSDAGAGAETPDLSGSSWMLATYADSAGTSTPAVSSRDGAPLAFGADGALNGSTGCNSFGGTYVQEGDSLTISLGPMTLMACPGELGDQESAVVDALPQVASFTADGDLVLMSEAGDVLLTYSPGMTDLAGTSWQATGVNNGKEAVVSSAATESITASFGDDGTLTGSGGCNSYQATYTLGGEGDIAIGPVAATKKACPDEIMQAEQQYFAALGASTTYSIDGTSLTLRDAQGATQVSFRLSS